MAKISKQGIDYFPMDVHLDDKFKFIEIKFGFVGFAVIIKLYQRIYSQGYWCDFGEDEMMIFAHEINVDLDVLNDVLKEALKREIFSNEKYENYQILTSRGIQQRYNEITKRRKEVDIVDKYVVNDNISTENVNTMYTRCIHDVDKSEQSKVKESKVKESKVNYLLKKETKSTSDFQENEFINFESLEDGISLKKPEPEKRKKVAQKKEIEMPPLPFGYKFKEAFEMWLSYKKEQFRFSYKSESSLKLFLNDLVKKSGNNEQTAVDIINQSIANGYKGIFELKKANNGNQFNNNNQQQPKEQPYIGRLTKSDVDASVAMLRQMYPD